MSNWRDIPGYEGLYQISDSGDVMSLPRIVGKKYRRISIIRKGTTSGCGYSLIHLSKESKIVTYTVHRLVAKAFIPNPENKPEVNHKNGIKTDNRVENLEWVTSKENLNHAVTNKLIGKNGGRSNRAILRSEDVLNIIKSNKPNNEMAMVYGVSESGIKDIRRGKNWSHVTGIYYKPKKRVA